MDVFLYSGMLERQDDLAFMDLVDAEWSSDSLLLVLASFGGSPDAAYKIGRYLQSRYTNITVLVPGFCKSAGTLLAICANELVFSPYGELGPLDVQMARSDKLTGLESGLNISEAFMALEKRARDMFHDLVQEIIGSSNGIISFQTASKSANEMIASLYGPVFAGIDPEEVGSRARAMRIGEDYAGRLNLKFKNLRRDALRTLSRTYSNHGFVIDVGEAQHLFERVRLVNDVEKKLIQYLGDSCRMPGELRIENLAKAFANADGSQSAGETNA